VVLKASVPPFGRITRDVAADVGRDKDVSITVRGDAPLVAERPEYFDYHGQWAGGEATMGATDPAAGLLLLGGVHLLLGARVGMRYNPGATEAHVQVSYQMAGGTHAASSLSVGAHKRYTLDVAGVIGLDKDVSVALHSDAGVVAERSQYFSYGPGWDGGAFGSGPRPPERRSTSPKAPPGRTHRRLLRRVGLHREPGSAVADIKLTFVKPDGINIVQSVTVGSGDPLHRLGERRAGTRHGTRA